MHVLVVGATGYIGRAVTKSLAAKGHRVTALTRNTEAAMLSVPGLVSARGWSPPTPPAAAVFEGIEAVVALTGEPVVGRWTAAKKRRLYGSRVGAVRGLVETMASLPTPPKVLVSGSAVGYYGDRGNEELTEISEAGGDFLARLTVDWEAAAQAAEAFGTRVVRIRTGLVVGPGAPFLRPQLPLYKLGLGGRLGNGRQWWPWVHVDDIAGLFVRALEDASWAGPVNGSSPAPVRQGEFARLLGRVLRRPALVWAPALAIKLVLGEMAAEVLTSKRVLPRAALDADFDFAYLDLETALRDALTRW